MTIPNKDKLFTSYIENNPFNILGVTCLDNRRKIVSVAEEMSFLLSDTDKCAEAQNVLVTPSKRLSAELDWFIETDISVINEIKECLNNNAPILIDSLNELSQLNALIYNCCISDETDSFSIGMEILDIDKQFGELDQITLVEIINDCRRIAKMAEITEYDISSELSKKRERIRSVISEKLQLLNKADYIELITFFAEKYIANDEYDESGIITDIIDQYEIWAKSVMETKEDEIRDCIDIIKKSDNDSELEHRVSVLVEWIKEWDKYAQPIQVTLAFRGNEDETSRDIAIAIRDLAVYLHNEKGRTELSLKLVKALKFYFAELSEVYDAVSKDEEKLEKMQEEKEEFKRKKEQNRRADKKYSVGIYDNKFAIPHFCTCCMKPTENKEEISHTTTLGNTQRTIRVNLPICYDCLKHRNAHTWFLVLICSVAIIVGVIAMMSLWMIAEINGFYSFVAALGVAGVFYYLLSFLFKTKELGEEHSTRGKSVEIFSSFFGSTPGFRNKRVVPDITFTFTNWEYAQLFWEANKEQADEVKEKTSINTAKRTSFLKANAHHVATMFIMLAVFTVIAAIIGVAVSESGNSSDYSSYTPSYSDSSSDYNASSNYSESSDIEKKFSLGVSSGTKVYENIVSIFPEVGIYTEGSFEFTSFVCRCKTSVGKTVWVHMSVWEYRDCFDSSASYSKFNMYAEEVKFTTPKKIHGTAKQSDSVLSGLSSDIGSFMLIDFDSVD